jgi:tetratricopeptide (TPR) repeat protein
MKDFRFKNGGVIMKTFMKVSLASWALAVILGCATPELQKVERADTSDNGYRAYNELIEYLSRVPTIYNSNPYYKPVGRGIRAEWAGNYEKAAEAFREGLSNPSYWQTEYAAKAKTTWIPLFHAFLGHALFHQGKTEEAYQNYSIAEPSFEGLMQQIPHDRYEKGTKLFYAYHYKVYGQILEQRGETRSALRMYQKSLSLGAGEAQSNIVRLEEAAMSQSKTLKESLQQAETAEQQGQLQEALKHYTAALASSLLLSEPRRIDFQLAQRTIAIARRIEPPPAIPEGARRHAVYAQTAIKEAKDQRDYEKAIEEYLKAICFSPWWADLYVNAALTCEQMKRYREAHNFLAFYLSLAPEAPDAEQIRAKLYQLESKAKQGGQ